jgi:aerotaxis receptor
MSSYDTRLSEVATTEAVFQLNELFFSRTDERGVIISGNSVFQRVSGFTADELVNAPHKIVRHPDMPKAVFQLQWDRIKAGKPTGAYVKNQRKGGRFYWVFALVMPCNDGYISVRLKPTGPTHQKVMELYDRLLKDEREKGLTPEASRDSLLAALAEMGFDSYDAFQSHALGEEFEVRARQLGRNVSQLQKRFMDMARAIHEVQVETSEMTEAFKAIRTVPMNMRIIASRLENAGGPIGAISVNYSQMLEEMSAWVDTFVDGDECVFARMRSAILQGQFMSLAVALGEELADQFRMEQSGVPADLDLGAEVKLLEEHSERTLVAMNKALENVEAEARRFARSVLDMKRYVTGLSSTRMMCKIESAALAGSDTALSGIVEQLDVCQDEIEGRLAKIVEWNSVIQSNTAMLRSLI